ncbi:MAG: OmpA family protein [Gemmatimonadota bacterium]
MPDCMASVLRRLIAGGTLSFACALTPFHADAQGIGFSLTPSVEELRWGEDLLVAHTLFPGALLSAHFGRFVALDGHYFRSGALDVEESATDMIASRWGGDVRFVLAPTPLAPFIRVGVGVVEFRPDVEDGAPSRHLATSLGGGVRFDLRERLGGELSVHRRSFRAGPGSGVVADDGSEDPRQEISAYALGLGVQVPLGGSWNDPETDEAVRNLRALTVPVRIFGGSLGFSDELGLTSHAVMGALVGADFGPFVGASLYAFGSARDGLTTPEALYGYGLEGSFNLVRRGAGATPHLLLGGGRMHFTEEARLAAELDERKKWTATVGAGVDFRVTDRFRGEVSARNLVLSQRATQEVSSPDQLRSNWLFSAGVRFVVGGARQDGARADRDIERPAGTGQRPAGTTGAKDEPSNEDERTRPTSEDLDALELERDLLIRELEVERLRQALDRLRNEGDPAAAERLLAEYRGDSPAPPAPRSFEVPVLEQGEIRVRFGPESAGDTTAAPMDAPTQPQPASVGEAPRDPRVDALLESVGRLEGRLEELLERPPQQQPSQPLDVQINVPGVGTPGAGGVVAEEAPRGVLHGEAPGLDGFGAFTGARLDPVDQALVGIELDVGSAFGGDIRLRPDITLGLTNGFTWGVDAHLMWPAPVEIWGLRPEVGAGAGIFREGGITRVMIPNVSAGLTRALTDRLQGFLTLKTLDFFDDHRLVAGVRLLPSPEPPRPSVDVDLSTAAAGPPAGAPTEQPSQQATPDPEAEQEREALRSTLEELREEMRTLRNDLTAAEEATPDTVVHVTPEPDVPDAEPTLLERFRTLERLESVQSVRRVARGVAIVLGGGDTFGVGEDQLSPLAHSEIATVADLLVGDATAVSVEGHTDSTGGAELNLRLSRARAEAVRAALLAHGVASSRVSAVGFGSNRPVEGNATAEGRAANRRVEIIVLLDESE